MLQAISISEGVTQSETLTWENNRCINTELVLF